MSDRKRSSNWQMSEKMLLVDLVTEHFSIVENKHTDAVTMKQKNAEWFEVRHGPAKPKLEDNLLYRKFLALISTTVVGLVNEYDSDNMRNNHVIIEQIPSNALASAKGTHNLISQYNC
ncbi:unnamed protein product [Parnassius apollo]|uniref:Regulatory protein zeste n=1 Tax=Parnassius apollo TaxID=110799 RepID=A0A8S3XVL8_PARAO|nr:unnamed protein product [Parnassius apollo]